MQYKFLNIFLDPKELLEQTKNKINPQINQFLLENNVAQIEKIYNFYKSNLNLLYVNGFLGTGKAQIVDYTTSFLSVETIILKYNCFNSTVLDDMLLSFFNDFKKLSAQNIISEPKVKTENFTQKINSYFSQIEKPFLIILDSFEAILDENRQEILDFIFHFNSISKIKIIIIGRSFESKYFKDVNLERVSTFALDRQVFEKYLKSEKIKAQSGIIDELYKHTHGYYFFTALSIKLMNHDDLSLIDFLIKLKDSYLTFLDFLGRQALGLVPSSERDLFGFLSIIRHPVSVDLLKKLSFYDEEKITFMKENLLLIEDNSQIYIRDFLKDKTEDSIATSIAHRIRQYVIDLYISQLPIKPLERDICISRQTMRKEIEYHKLFLPKKPKNVENVGIDINYMTYTKAKEDFAEKFGPKKEERQLVAPHIDLTQRKNISINLENLPFQNKDKQYSPKEVLKKQPLENYVNKMSPDETSEFDNLNITELMNMASQAESKYNYAKVVDICKRALLLKNDSNYQTSLTLIYTKLAFAYQKVADYENALKCYDLLKTFYEQARNYAKMNHIKFNIAKILYETYKIETAKNMFQEIINSPDSPRTLLVRTFLQLATIEENLSNSQNTFDNYTKAIQASDENMDVEILSELYFRYALALDDKNEVKTAIDFYNKCINLSNDPKTNKFLSSAYSNIATLYLEKNDTDDAILNFEKAFEIDKKVHNIEGMYYSSSKLASILQRKQPESALRYFEQALSCAKTIKDIFYIVSASLAIGDYHYDQKQNEIALKHYMYAHDLAENSFSRDNINKINIRINDIKFRIGADRFEELAEIIREQENE